VQPFDAPLERVSDATRAVAPFAPDPRLASAPEGTLSTRDGGAWRKLARALRESPDRQWSFAAGGERAGLVLPREQAQEIDAPLALSLPRIGVYSPWQGSVDEGWTRWMLDASEIPFTSVKNEMLRAGALARFVDVLVLPSLAPALLDAGRAEGSVPPAYEGGLDPEGAIAIEEFVRSGGTLVTFGTSGTWAIELMALPLADETRPQAGPATASESAVDFACPGSVLRVIPEPHALCADLPGSIGVFFSESSAWRVLSSEDAKKASLADPGNVEVLARYAPTRLLLSGWIRGGERIEGDAAWVRVKHGKGRVHLFGFRPQFRGWTQASFPLFVRSLLLDAPQH